MKYNFLQTLVFGCAIFASATAFSQNTCGSSSACPCPPQECPCPDSCEPCPPPAVCEQGYEAPEQLNGAYNAPARIDVRCSWDFFAQADFIYWDARQKGVELGMYSFVQVPETTGNVQGMDFEYKPGFKVGLGCNPDHDNWTIFAQYTYFHNSLTQSADKDRLNQFHSPWTFFLDDIRESAKARWKRDFDILDLELSRAYYVGTLLTFQPFFGTRAYWFTQKYDMTAVSSDGDNLVNTNFLGTQKSWAFGARCGIDTRWLISDGFRLFGNAAADLVYQSFSTRFAQRVEGAISNKQKEKAGYIVPNFELALGLGWGKYFNNSNFHIDLAAGYELHYFWNQNMIRKLVDNYNYINRNFDGDAGDLMLHGLTVSARFDF